MRSSSVVVSSFVNVFFYDLSNCMGSQVSDGICRSFTEGITIGTLPRVSCYVCYLFGRGQRCLLAIT